MTKYQLEKTVWTEKDFENMGWHDCTIWSTSPNPEQYEYLLDLDYIFEWIDPPIGEKYFKFLVSPVTMVFENANDIKTCLSSNQGLIEISELKMEFLGLSPNKKFKQYSFNFDCREGELSLIATGFKLYVRQPPKLLSGQYFELSERGGVSFSREN